MREGCNIKRKIIAALLLFCFLLSASCSAPENPPANSETPIDTEEEQPEEKTMNITVTVGAFQAKAELYDNPAARALLDRLPLTLSMQELHGNEKYYYFDASLPAAAESVGSISAGDLMLYGDDCLVLFYQSFSTPHRYTPLGKLKTTDGLAAALGSGAVTVTFSK